MDAGQSRGHQVKRVWLEPDVPIHPAVAEAIRGFDAVIIGPGSFFTSLMPPLLVRGVKEALADMRGPIILISNLLTEGRGMAGFTAADGVRWISDAIGRPVDVVIANTGRPSIDALARYEAEHKRPLELGDLEPGTEPVLGRFWCTEIARHHRRRLSLAVWTVLSQRLLSSDRELLDSPSTVAVDQRAFLALVFFRATAFRLDRRSGFERLRTTRTIRTIRTHFERPGDDLLEHRSRLAALRRAVRLPDVRIVRGQNVGEVPFALHAERRELRDVHVARPVVAVLDQQPGSIGAARRPSARLSCERAPTTP